MNQLTFFGMETPVNNGTPTSVAKRKRSNVLAFPASKKVLEGQISAAEILSPAEVRRVLEVPKGVSKSLAKTLGCPTYFTGQQLQQETIGQGEPHYLAKTGIEFHAWRMHYV